MFCRDLIPRYLDTPHSAAALSLTCKWMYTNVTAEFIAVDGCLESAYYARALPWQSMGFATRKSVAVIFDRWYWDIPAWAARFIKSPIYYYSHTTEKCPPTGTKAMFTRNKHTTTYGDEAVREKYEYEWRVFTAGPPLRATFADLPGEIVAILMGMLRDSRPLGLTSARNYGIFEKTPDYIYRNAPLSADTPAKFCLQYSAEQLYIVGNAAGLAYWYRKTGVNRSTFLQRLIDVDITPADSAATAEWLYRRFRAELVNYIEHIIQLGHSELVKLLIPHATLTRSVGVRYSFAMFRMLFENYPALRDELTNDAIVYCSPTACVTFASLYGVNPIKNYPGAFCESLRLLQSVTIAHALEGIADMDRAHNNPATLAQKTPSVDLYLKQLVARFRWRAGATIPTT